MHPLLQQLAACDGVSSAGICAFDALMEGRAQAAERSRALCPDAQSVLVALFPYLSAPREGNLSLYARGRDYHLVVRQALEPLCRQAREQYPGHRFVALCDSSPLPEVAAAHLAGVGTLGQNGLIFDRVYGSFVFIGCILTDLNLPVTPPGDRCPGCGACRQGCPTGALGEHGLAAPSCLSHLNQTGGQLTAQQQSWVADSPLIWGCDGCSLSCPLNAGVPLSPNPAFTENTLCALTLSDVAGLTRRELTGRYPERAFTWKGPAPLVRNLNLQQGDETP